MRRRDLLRLSATAAALAALGAKEEGVAAAHGERVGGMTENDAPHGNSGGDLPDADLTLRYRAPAQKWVEALPIGSGGLGGMVYGGIARERLALNEDAVWSGIPHAWDNPAAKAILPEVRKAIFAGRYSEADALCRKMQG